MAITAQIQIGTRFRTIASNPVCTRVWHGITGKVIKIIGDSVFLKLDKEHLGYDTQLFNLAIWDFEILEWDD